MHWARVRFWSCASLVTLTGCRRDADGIHADPLASDASPVRPEPPMATGPSHVEEYFSNPESPPALPVTPPKCVASVGCPTTRPLPICYAPAFTYTVDAVMADAPRFEGRVVTVRAPIELVSHRITLVGGPPGLCVNEAWGEVGFVIGKGASRVELHLWNHHERARFNCNGDDSALCCAVPFDRRFVHATGVFRSYVDLETFVIGGHPTLWFLDDVEVCDPRAE
jgi:hypothetical protein